MYLDKNPFNMANIYKMHEKCSHCGQPYKIEPSFYFGAMYVSYGLGVGISIIAFIISFSLLKTSLKTAFIVIIASLVIPMPIIMRVSRNIWINLFVSYDKNWRELKKP
jgi:uncharacterized protein (DUF983 family)